MLVLATLDLFAAVAILLFLYNATPYWRACPLVASLVPGRDPVGIHPGAIAMPENPYQPPKEVNEPGTQWTAEGRLAATIFLVGVIVIVGLAALGVFDVLR